MVDRSQILARPRGLFGSTIALMDGDREAALLSTSQLRSRAQLSAGGATFTFRREKRWGKFVLETGERQLASAVKPSVLRNRFVVMLGEAELELRPAGFFNQDFVVSEAGREVGRISPRGLLRLGGTLALPTSWPVPLQAFTFWLAWLMWKRQRAASSG